FRCRSLRRALRRRCRARRRLLCGAQPVKVAQKQGRAQLSRQAYSAQFDLLEREAELAAIDGLISAGPSGDRLLAIEGPPRVRKTPLLPAAQAGGPAARV